MVRAGGLNQIGNFSAIQDFNDVNHYMKISGC